MPTPACAISLGTWSSFLCGGGGGVGRFSSFGFLGAASIEKVVEWRRSAGHGSLCLEAVSFARE